MSFHSVITDNGGGMPLKFGTFRNPRRRSKGHVGENSILTLIEFFGPDMKQINLLRRTDTAVS